MSEYMIDPRRVPADPNVIYLEKLSTSEMRLYYVRHTSSENVRTDDV